MDEYRSQLSFHRRIGAVEDERLGIVDRGCTGGGFQTYEEAGFFAPLFCCRLEARVSAASMDQAANSAASDSASS
jgi:hypothetical protein